MSDKIKKLKRIDSIKKMVLFFGTLLFILASIAIPGNRVARSRAREKACIANLRTLEGAYEMFVMDLEDNTFDKFDPQLKKEIKQEKIEISEKSIFGKAIVKLGYMKSIPKCRENGTYFIRKKKKDTTAEHDNGLQIEGYCTEHNTVNDPHGKNMTPLMTGVVKKYASKVILVSLLMTLLAIIRAKAFPSQALLKNSSFPLYSAMVLSLIPVWVIILYFKSCFDSTAGLQYVPLIFFIASYFLNFLNAVLFLKSSCIYIELRMKRFLSRLVLFTVIPGIISFLLERWVDGPSDNPAVLTMFILASIIFVINLVTQPVTHFFESWKALVEINYQEET